MTMTVPAWWRPDWVDNKDGSFYLRNWPPEIHDTGDCVSWDRFTGYLSAYAEAGYRKGQEDAAAGIDRPNPAWYIAPALDDLADHLHRTKTFRNAVIDGERVA